MRILIESLQNMSKSYQINTFVDLYFQYFERAIPKEFKEPLLAIKSISDKTRSNELTAQLYIISAYIFGILVFQIFFDFRTCYAVLW